VSLFSSQAVTGRTKTYNSQFEKWVADLTPNEINGSMRKYIDQSKITIVKAGDFKNHPPKSPSVVP
jgi:zinc protease